MDFVFMAAKRSKNVPTSNKDFLQFGSGLANQTASSHSGLGPYGLGVPPSFVAAPEQFQVTKPRMRICFDPETEIPKLQKWFAENNHPTRQQV